MMGLVALLLVAAGLAWLLLAWLLPDEPVRVSEPDPPAWMVRQLYDDAR